MFEQLEARSLLSAVVNFSDGVTASQSGSGSLVIKMDSKATKGGSKAGPTSAAAMNITVIENGISQTNGGVQIGLGNVLVHDNITGEEMVFFNVKPNKSVQIQGGKGDDTIFFQGATLGADIKGDDGNDMITVLDAGSASSKIDSGNGDDTIAIVFSQNAEIKTGNGNDLVLINTSADPNAGTGGYDYDHSNIKVQGQGGSTTVVVDAGNVKANGGHTQVVNA